MNLEAPNAPFFTFHNRHSSLLRRNSRQVKHTKHLPGLVAGRASVRRIIVLRYRANAVIDRQTDRFIDDTSSRFRDFGLTAIAGQVDIHHIGCRRVLMLLDVDLVLLGGCRIDARIGFVNFL